MSSSARFTRPALLILLLVLAALLAVGCGDDSDDGGSDGDSKGAKSTETSGGGADDNDLDATVAKRDGSYDASPGKPLDASKTYIVELDTTKGPIKITVDPKLAPIAAANFVGLVEEGFYDGVKFHRVIEEFMVQTGDPLGTGTGGPGYEIKDDPNVVANYKPGVVAMANRGPNTGGSQFFIVQGDAVQLPPDYVIFGKTDAAGIKTVNAIAAVEVEGEAPVETVRINSAKLAS
ncbi:MAG: peptidylprolyl isomerase [Thermoleophilia bacterium]|nr:peptidylprolyl isomerase [Thermoleophilia bacterium]MCZ4496427.1 peptidylprolyl isomerase [Thermoleophilia bacterium]